MIRSIEGLRGVAALLVALFHAYVYGRWGGEPAHWGVLQHAWLFVDLFFVISGYVMAAAYSDRLRTPAMLAGYMARRFLRLYPLHLVTTIGVVLTALAVQTAKWVTASQGVHLGGEKPFAVPIFDLDYFGLELVLLQGVGIMQKEIHNYPSWSISVEFWMYLFFAVSMLAVQTRWLRVAFSAAVVSLCLTHFLASWSSGSSPATLDVQGLPRGLLSFFLGVLVFQAWYWCAGAPHAAGNGPLVRWLQTAGGRGVLGLLQLGALLLALWLVDRQDVLGFWQLAIPFAFALLVVLLLPDHGPAAALLKTAPMQWLGVHSYAIYLTHVAVQTVLDWPGRVVPEPAKHLVGLLYIVAVLVLSMLAHRFVEVPWRDRGKRLASRLETAGGPAGDPELRRARSGAGPRSRWPSAAPPSPRAGS